MEKQEEQEELINKRKEMNKAIDTMLHMIAGFTQDPQAIYAYEMNKLCDRLQSLMPVDTITIPENQWNELTNMVKQFYTAFNDYIAENHIEIKE